MKCRKMDARGNSRGVGDPTELAEGVAGQNHFPTGPCHPECTLPTKSLPWRAVFHTPPHGWTLAGRQTLAAPVAGVQRVAGLREAAGPQRKWSHSKRGMCVCAHRLGRAGIPCACPMGLLCCATKKPHPCAMEVL